MKVSIKYSKNHRDKTNVTIESRDLWNGDVTLAKVIYPFLKKYRNLYNGKNSMCSYPMAFAPETCKPEGPDNQDRFDEWIICLDKMIYAFGWIAKNHNWDGPECKNFNKACAKALKPYKKELKKLAAQDIERFKELKPNGALNSLEWDKKSEILQPIYAIYFKKFKEHHNKIQEGIDLFARYYGSLWT
jgi:hypothetical protein